MKTIDKIIINYFNENPFIHLGIEELINVLNYENSNSLKSIDIKISSLALVSQGKLQMDKNWRLHK